MLIEFDITSEDDITAVLQALASDRWLDSPLRQIAQRLSAAERQHYLEIARSTPYSSGYLGKTKPSGQVVAGGRGDRGYGIDTGALLESLSNPIIREQAIIIETPIIYADEQESLLNRKGRSFLLDDEDALDIAEAVLVEYLEALF
jgi:hypothetical protein